MMKRFVLLLIVMGLLWLGGPAKATLTFQNKVIWNPVADYLAVSSQPDTLLIYDANTLTVVNQLSGLGEISLFAWNNAGTQIVVSVIDEVFLWTNPLSGQEVIYLESVDDFEDFNIRAFAWSPNDNEIVGAVGGYAYIWDIDLRNISRDFVHDWDRINAIIWTDNNELVMSNSDSNIYVVDSITTEILKQLYISSFDLAGFWGMDVSPDGKWVVASRTNDYSYLWNYQAAPVGFNQPNLNDPNFKRIGELIANPIKSIDWHPNGLLVATGGQNGDVQIWNPFTNELLQAVTGFMPESLQGADTGASVSWSPDGTRLAYISPAFELPVVIIPDVSPELLVTPTPSAVPTSAITSCTITTLQDVNLRSGPDTTFEQLGSRLAGDTLSVDAQYRDGSSMVWWRLSDAGVDTGLWVRGDLVREETQDCFGITDLSGQPIATRTPGVPPTATETPTALATNTPIETVTPTELPTNTPTETPSPTFTATETATSTFTPTNTATFTPTATHTPPASPTASATCSFNVAASDTAGLISALSSPSVICLGGGTYALSAVHNNDDGPGGLPTITKNVTINGNGAIIERVSSAPSFRIFRILNTARLALFDVTVRGGNSGTGTGGGIRNLGTLELTNVIVENNTGSNGAGIRVNNNATFIATNSTIRNNTSTTSGGGLYLNNGSNNTLNNVTIFGNTTNSTSGLGGGIFTNANTLVVNGGIIQNNSARNGGGLFLNITTQPVNLTNVNLVGNTASNHGGAIYNPINTSFVVTNNRFTNNIAVAEGGAIGGDGVFTITNTNFTGNIANIGGAIHTSNVAGNSITQSCISGNTASNTIGIFNDNTVLLNATNNFWGTVGASGSVSANVDTANSLTTCPSP
jgi:WD40 repeat protein